LTEENKINIMIVRGDQKEIFSKLPSLDESIKKIFAEYALEQAMLMAKEYPPQMRDLVVDWSVGGFIGSTVALMLMDLLYENGTFKPLREEEKVTANLLMFCDRLPE
jgi:predicted DNA-binding antitoxin AbrB/MazE fold protein